MIVRLITPLTNSAGTLSVVSADANNNVVIENIVENVAGATAQNNPDLYRQLWNYVGATDNNGNYIVSFQNLYTNTYLSCLNGTNNGTQLVLDASATPQTSNWIIKKQNNMPNDDSGAPRSYSIHALNHNSQVIDLSGYNTTPGTIIQMYSWKGQPPYDNQYNQFWFLEEPRIQVVTPYSSTTIQVGVNYSSEVIQVWDSEVGGNLLGSLGNDYGNNLTVYNHTFYVSSKKPQNGYLVNESENQKNQTINLENNSNVTVQFYYGDPRQGTSISFTSGA